MAGGNIASYEGDRDRARALFERGLTLARAAGPADYVAKFLTELGNLDREDGDATSARARLTEALELRDADDFGAEAVVNAILALVCIDDGAFDEASKLLEASAATFGSMGDQARRAISLSLLAYVLIERGELGEGESALRDALRLAVDRDDFSLAGGVLVVAAWAKRESDPRRAGCWLGFAESAYARVGRHWGPLERRLRDQTILCLRSVLDDLELAETTNEGARLARVDILADACAATGGDPSGAD